MMKYAQIVVNTPVVIRKPLEEQHLPESLRERAFTYSIPNHLADQIALGQLVWVPFGSRRIQGIVIAFSELSPVEQTKDVDEIADPRPLLNASQIDLARWIATTYLCPLYDALQLMFPPGIEQPTEIHLSLAPNAPRENLTPKQIEIIESLDIDDETKLSSVPNELRNGIDRLVERGIVIKRTYVPPVKVKPKIAKYVALIADQATINQALEVMGGRNFQADVLEHFLRQTKSELIVDDICQAVGCSKSTIKTLADKSWIEIVPKHKLVSLTDKYFGELPELPKGQARTVTDLAQSASSPTTKELKDKKITSSEILNSLEEKGYVQLKLVPTTAFLRIDPQTIPEQIEKLRGIKSRCTAIVNYLDKENKPVWISALYASLTCELDDLQKLEAAGIVALEEEEVWRDSLAGRVFDVVEPPKLTSEQEAAWENIVSSFKSQVSGKQPETVKPETFLLHGVTGSGKTEIYMRALAEIIAQGKQGIVLVPEISLTPQTIRRFGARFKRMAVLHSRLSPGERYDTWRRCRDGLVDLVIGSRSALFAPLPRLGLVAIDEEHDAAYKQESVPHYHAREVALEIARRIGATVILGSATPDVETYYRATRGEFKLLELPKRVMGHRDVIQNEITNYQLPTAKLSVHEVGADYADARYIDLPPVEIVDLRAELKAGNRSMFSRALQREMARVLAASEQVILFLNRRGTATFILCRDCGNVFKCKRCDNPMTYHGTGDQLVCHHCNRRDRVPTKCPNCGSARIRYFGVGTEKVEEEIQKAFPKARTLRWDYDVTRGKDSHEAILEKIVQHQADILIGTQMIAKGLDLPLVTLVGVISADTSLNLPDFRSGERTFQLLTQVAGRAGRSILGGKVIIQTYNPDHYAIQAASTHDYRAFYEHEIAFRREQHYPPYSRLVRLLFTHANEKQAQQESARMFGALTTRIAQRGLPSLDLIGPAPAFFHRVRGQYRYQILLRGDAERPHALIQDLVLPLGWRVDVDPVSVL